MMNLRMFCKVPRPPPATLTCLLVFEFTKSVCMSVLVGVCTYGSACHTVRISVCLSLWMSVPVGLPATVRISVRLSLCVSVCLSLWMSVCLFLWVSICLSLWTSVCLSLCMSVPMGLPATQCGCLYVCPCGSACHTVTSVCLSLWVSVPVGLPFSARSWLCPCCLPVITILHFISVPLWFLLCPSYNNGILLSQPQTLCRIVLCQPDISEGHLRGGSLN